MPADNSSVKPTQASPAPEATSVEDAVKSVSEELGLPAPGVKEAEVSATTGADPQEPAANQEPEPPAKDGTQEGEQLATEEPTTEQETETAPEAAATEPATELSPREQKRARELSKENIALREALKEKEARLLAIANGEIQPPAPANGTATPATGIATPPPQQQPTEYSSHDIRAYVRALSAAKEAGQPLNGVEVTQDAIDAAQDMLQRQIHREVVREEQQRERAQANARDSRAWVVKKCIALESRDPRFSLLDADGKVADTPFAKAVKAEAIKNRVRNDHELILTAYEVADQVRNGELELAQAQAAQAVTQTRKVIKQTSLASPSHAKAGAAPKPKTPVSGRDELHSWITS